MTLETANRAERQLAGTPLPGPFVYNSRVWQLCDKAVTEKPFAFILQKSEMRKTKTYSFSSELLTIWQLHPRKQYSLYLLTHLSGQSYSDLTDEEGKIRIKREMSKCKLRV